MGTRGPQPTPTSILKIRGSRMAKEREKAGEPMPDRGVPTRPQNVTNESRVVWSAVTRMLDEMTVLTRVDGGQLERYCLMFVQWRQIQRAIARFSNTDDMLIASLRNDETRQIVRNLWAEYHKLDASLKQTEMQFGLTPAARARLTCMVAGDSEKVTGDDFANKFFCGAG